MIPSKKTKVEALLEEAADLQAQMQPYAALKDRYDLIRYEIQQELTALKSKRSEAHAGYYAVRQEKKTFQIRDEAEAAAWLTNNEADLDTLSKLDTKAVESFVKAHFRDTGELPEGMGYDITEYVVVKPEKADLSSFRESLIRQEQE